MLAAKRFLVQTPFKWHTKFKLHRTKSADVVKNLIDMDGRVFIAKRSTFDTEESYLSDTCLYTRYADCIESHPKCISSYDYYDLVREHKKKDASELRMTEYRFLYDGRPFDLEVYDAHPDGKGYVANLNGLVIINQIYVGELNLPPYLDIGEEITNNTLYSSYSLAHRGIDRSYDGRYTDDNNDQTGIQRA